MRGRQWGRYYTKLSIDFCDIRILYYVVLSYIILYYILFYSIIFYYVILYYSILYYIIRKNFKIEKFSILQTKRKKSIIVKLLQKKNRGEFCQENNAEIQIPAQVEVIGPSDALKRQWILISKSRYVWSYNRCLHSIWTTARISTT